MALKTAVCRLLNIDYPIILAGMPWVSNAELAAAVSEAGGLGVVSPSAGMPYRGDLGTNLVRQVRKARSLTQRPIGVSIFLGLRNAQDLLKAAVKEGVRVFITAGPNLPLYTGFLKGEEAKVLHIVASVHHARAAEAAGVDGVIAQGIEAGGFVAPEAVPTFALLPQVVDAVEVAVLASGGIAEGRGMAAALSLGAQGVYVGTRFIATDECIAHPRYKEALVSAVDTGTLLLSKGRLLLRVLKTEGTLKQQREVSAARAVQGKEPWERYFLSKEVRAAHLEGDLVKGLAYAGAAAGLVNDILPAKEVVARMVKGAEEVLKRLA